MLRESYNTLNVTFLTICLTIVFFTWVYAEDDIKLVATDSNNVAIKGYDTVAYFTEGKAIKGTPEFTVSWHDVQWRFANVRHRDLFASNPERYAPQFGGFCSAGLSMGKKVVADPEQWTIVDGKLYINYNRSALESWRQEKAARIHKANVNWSNYLNGGTLETVVK
jgi:hypothetical protein